MTTRKPAILELAGGKSNRQRIWETIRAFSQRPKEPTFTMVDIARRTKIEDDIISLYLRSLVAGKWLSLVSPEKFKKHVYRLERDTGVEAPRVRRDGSEVTQGRGVEAMWGSMQILDSFTAESLSTICGVKINTAKTYIGALLKAGYLKELREGKGIGKGGVLGMYCLLAVANSGPRAPQITRLHVVYDPNLHKIMWSEGPDEAVEAIEQ